jgi:hypothetical protein
MTSNNYLVTYTDLTTMGLPPKGSPATGNQIATKQFVVNNYYVDEAASPFSTYAYNRCPRYQDIIPGTTVQSYGYTDTFAGECFCCPGQYETQRDYTVVFNAPAVSNGYLAIVYDDASGENVNYSQGETSVSWFSNCGCINPCLTITSVTVFPT